MSVKIHPGESFDDSLLINGLHSTSILIDATGKDKHSLNLDKVLINISAFLLYDSKQDEIA
jgi:hypothetical protein